MNIKPIYAILLLLIISLGVYHNSLYGEFFNMDDKGPVEAFKNNSISIKEMFFPPQGKIFIYYRPLTLSSFYLDYLIWGDEPFGYHLHSIIIHALNTVLFYVFPLLLFETIVFKDKQPPIPLNRVGHEVVPLFAAFLFSIHPINTEAVNWISARGDLYAAFFLLLALICYLLDSKIPLIPFLSLRTGLILSSIFYLLSILSKESTIILPLILWGLGKIAYKGAGRLKELIFYFSPSLLVYLCLRYLSLTAGGISMKGPSDVLNRQLFQPLVEVDFFAVFLYMLNFSIHLTSSLGFYFKKLIYPFPLNFAIYEIDDRYGIIGCLIILILIFWARLPLIKPVPLIKTSRASSDKAQESESRTTALQGLKTFLFYSSLVSLLPLFYLSLGNVAWTLYAERYLYLCSMFFSLLFVVFVGDIIEYGIHKKPLLYFIFYLLPTAYCLLFAVATYQRNEVWRTNISLWEDTVKKSPDFGYIHTIYGDSLMENMVNDKAKEEFNKAIILGERQAAYNLGLLAMEEGDYDVAEKHLLSVIMNPVSINTLSRTGDAFEKLADLYMNKMTEFSEERRGYVLKIIEYYKRRSEKENNPEFFFKIEQLYFKIGLSSKR